MGGDGRAVRGRVAVGGPAAAVGSGRCSRRCVRRFAWRAAMRRAPAAAGGGSTARGLPASVTSCSKQSWATGWRRGSRRIDRTDAGAEARGPGVPSPRETGPDVAATVRDRRSPAELAVRRWRRGGSNGERADKVRNGSTALATCGARTTARPAVPARCHDFRRRLSITVARATSPPAAFRARRAQSQSPAHAFTRRRKASPG